MAPVRAFGYTEQLCKCLGHLRVISVIEIYIQAESKVLKTWGKNMTHSHLETLLYCVCVCVCGGGS